ncbi:MAG: dihydropteridine reductase [Clostridia bacterium]|nr:dihydropteridine reductase [Clostridia bacterium]
MVNEKERKAVENIQKAYTEKKMTKLDELRALDQSIRRPANVFAYVFGGLGSLVLGGGMSLLMTEAGSVFGAAAFPVGLALGIVGLAAVSVNYFLYKAILERSKKKHAAEVFALGKEILGE